MQNSVDLGKAPASGADAVTQCNFFKGILKNRVAMHSGMSLERYSDGPDNGLAIVYDPRVSGAREKADNIKSIAHDVWQEVISHKRAQENDKPI